MKCKKCGADLVGNAKFCINCGASVSDSKEKVNNSKEKVNNSYEDEELLKVYIGNNYEKIIKKGFNFPAFFIPNYYLLYRKCYSYFFIYLFVLMFFPIFMLPAAIFLGIMFNEMYVNQAKNEVTKAKIYNSYNVEDALKRKGGTSIIGPIVYTIVWVIIILLLVLLIVFLVNVYKDNKSSVFEHFNNFNESMERVTTVGDMRYTIPSGYKELNYSMYNSSYTYYGDETCHFEIKTVGEFDDVELKNETINGIEYYTYEENTSDNGYISSDNRYFTTFKEKNYAILFNSSNDIYSKCDNDRNSILNSITFTEEM